jgi:putative protease
MAPAAAPFELTTSVSNLRHLRASDLSAYDAVYLGNVYCRLYEGNLIESPAELREAIRVARDQGRQAYLTTYGTPRNDTLRVVRRSLEVAAAEGVAGVEVHSVGLLKLVHDEFSSLPIHVGNFANVYTDVGADVLKSFGATRITPHYELTLNEIDQIAYSCGLPLELLVHGKMPLGVSEFCILLEYEAKWGVGCPDLCQQEVFLRKEEGWGLKSVGKGILSGRDVCMLEHLPRLLASGYRHFRIEAVSECPAYRAAIGAVYREALTRAMAGDGRPEARWWQAIWDHARLGLCNGFYFGRSGMDYLGVHAAGDRLEGSRDVAVQTRCSP